MVAPTRRRELFDPFLQIGRGDRIAIAFKQILEQRRTLALHLATLASELPTLRAHVAELRAAASKRRADCKYQHVVVFTGGVPLPY